MNSRKTQVMGILNITPDSFSDGGFLRSREAVKHQVEKMVESGVDILDVGGESTRPFADPVSEQEELDRVIPVIEFIRQTTDTPVSIDTTKAVVAGHALDAGADIVNDISALRSDPDMVEVVKRYTGPVVIMHMKGTPGDMQIKPHYEDVITEISSFFQERIDWLDSNGIGRERIVIDPGIGFGKSVAHNLEILKNITEFKKLGCPVLIGHSRKSFIGKILDLEVKQRDCATAILSYHSLLGGADILRVHDVELTRQAVSLYSQLTA